MWLVSSINLRILLFLECFLILQHLVNRRQFFAKKKFLVTFDREIAIFWRTLPSNSLFLSSKVPLKNFRVDRPKTDLFLTKSAQKNLKQAELLVTTRTEGFRKVGGLPFVDKRITKLLLRAVLYY